MQETKRRSVKTEYNYQDAFDSNAARDLNLMPERSPVELPEKRDNVVKLTDKQLRKARMQGISPLRSVLSVVSVVLVFALLTFYIYGQVQLTELTENINNQKAQLAQLESVEIQLHMKAMADINVSEIETYARNELQMEPVNQNQITYISLTNQDVGEVIDGGSSNIFESIWSFLTSWA